MNAREERRRNLVTDQPTVQTDENLSITSGANSVALNSSAFRANDLGRTTLGSFVERALPMRKTSIGMLGRRFLISPRTAMSLTRLRVSLLYAPPVIVQDNSISQPS